MKRIITISVLLFMVLVPVWAMAGQVEGIIQGFTCVTQGKICPIDKEDPLVGATRVFVVKTSGHSYYLPNTELKLPPITIHKLFPNKSSIKRMDST